MSKFKIGDRVATNGAAPKDNTMQMMPNRVGTVVGYDTDGKNKVLMDGESEPSLIADHELDAVAAKRFRVRITRTEVYYRDVEVAADNLEDALQKVQDNEQNNEYAYLFDCPDDVSTTFKSADNN